MLYLVFIIASYLSSLYYGVQILWEAYFTDEYMQLVPQERSMLFVFIGLEVASGAALAFQIIILCCLGDLTKSQHLNEIQGEGFNVDMEHVSKVRAELELSKKASIELAAMKQAAT